MSLGTLQGARHVRRICHYGPGGWPRARMLEELRDLNTQYFGVPRRSV